MSSKLLVAISCILCTPISAFAGVSNIKQMSQNSNGYFNVICLNGHRETVSSEMILKNLVCQTATERSSSVRKAVICTGNEFHDWFYVTRIADGKQFGDFGEKLSLKACQQVVKASSSKVVCTGNEFHDWFYVTRIADGKKLGERLSLQACLQLSSNRE